MVDRPVVVLTRQSRYLGNTASILQTLEYQAVPVQTMQVKPRINDVVSDLFANLDRYTDIVFVSRNAVEIGMSILQQSGSKIPPAVRVMTVGPETAKQLYKYEIDALFPAVGTGAEALLAVKQLADLSDRKIVIVRGTKGLEWPAEEMRKRGAQVDHVDVYTHRMPDDAQDRMQDMLEAHKRIEGVFLHSAESAENFMQLVSEHLERFADATLVAGSQRIADTAIAAGWTHRVRIAKTPSNKDMMIAFGGSHDNPAAGADS
ncbi:MAG: uroporphyrinogen-III synthase [Pseudomonadota bacterium]